MKYCTHCGEQIDDDAVICPHCGCKAEGEATETAQPAPTKSNRGVTVAAEVFMVLTLVSTLICATVSTILAIVCGVTNTAIIDASAVINGTELGAVTACLIVFITFAVTCFVPLAWVIPMTVHVFRANKIGAPIGTGFKVCTLIFVNFIAGILLLCRRED